MSSALDKPVKSPVTFHPTSPIRRFKNGAAAVAFGLCFLVAFAPLVALLYMVIEKGSRQIASADWWQKSMYLATGNGGGVYHAIVGTLMQAGIAALISIPLGVFCAVYLVEYGTGTRFGKVTTFFVDVLAGVPSIVAALFVFGVWVSFLKLSLSGFAASLALVLLMVPVVVRSTEEMLKLVPNELREASYALGIPKWKTIMRVVLPTALSGVISGIFLAVARIIGETAPVLLLTQYTVKINMNPFDGSQTSLPLFIYQVWSSNPEQGVRLAWGGALTLIILVAIFSAIAAVASKIFSPKSK